MGHRTVILSILPLTHSVGRKYEHKYKPHVPNSLSPGDNPHIANHRLIYYRPYHICLLGKFTPILQFLCFLLCVDKKQNVRVFRSTDTRLLCSLCGFSLSSIVSHKAHRVGILQTPGTVSSTGDRCRISSHCCLDIHASTAINSNVLFCFFNTQSPELLNVLVRIFLYWSKRMLS